MKRKQKTQKNYSKREVMKIIEKIDAESYQSRIDAETDPKKGNPKRT